MTSAMSRATRSTPRSTPRSEAGPDAAGGRRHFLKLVGFAGLTSAVGSAMMAWAEPRPPRPGKAPPPSAPSPAPTAAPTDTAGQKPPEISEAARALAAIVQRRYGAHLSAEQLESVTRELEGRIQGGKRLRAAKLANHDEPDFTFRA